MEQKGSTNFVGRNGESWAFAARSATIVGKLEHVATQILLSAVEHVHVHVRPVVGEDTAVTGITFAIAAGVFEDGLESG